MQIRRAFRFELCPSGAQARLMSQFAGSCRYVYNRTLATEKSLYGKDKAHRFNYVECANRLVLWKKKALFSERLSFSSPPTSIERFREGIQEFFCQEIEFSKVQKKFQHDSFRFPQGVQNR